MWLIKPKQFENSGTYKLNLLYNKDKFYIMDNHLAASWCWLQKLDTKSNYQLFHIDRHYDLLDSQAEIWVNELKSQKVDLATISIHDLLKIEYTCPHFGTKKQLIRFDNYITTFLKIYPKIISQSKFATHKDGTKIDWFDFYSVDTYDIPMNLEYWINDFKEKTVLNIDIDYFFTDKVGDNNNFQFLTDEYMISICEKIEKVIDKIEVITIAMSPEFCGGWKNTYRVTKLIVDYFNLEFELKI